MIIKDVMVSDPAARRWAWRPSEAVDYFPIVLGLDCFYAGRSDHELPSDEVYCPCGITLPWPSQNVADLIEICEAHIADDHQGVRR